MKTIRVLFVCHGNICRSVMAQYIFEKIIKDRHLEDCFEVDSCATSREEIGNRIYPPAARKLDEKGVPYGNHRARQVTIADYDYYDHLIIMDENNWMNLIRIINSDKDNKVSMMMSWAGESRDVSDPWYTGNFEKTYQDCVAGINGFLKNLAINPREMI